MSHQICSFLLIISRYWPKKYQTVQKCIFNVIFSSMEAPCYSLIIMLYIATIIIIDLRQSHITNEHLLSIDEVTILKRSSKLERDWPYLKKHFQDRILPACAAHAEPEPGFEHVLYHLALALFFATLPQSAACAGSALLYLHAVQHCHSGGFSHPERKARVYRLYGVIWT